MKILLIGGNGQLGQTISKVLDKKFDLKILTNLIDDQNYCDISNKKSIIKIFEEFSPEVVINAAAFTDVERSEIYRAKANQVNNLSLEEITNQCLKRNSTLMSVVMEEISFLNNKMFSSSFLQGTINEILLIFFKTTFFLKIVIFIKQKKFKIGSLKIELRQSFKIGILKGKKIIFSFLTKSKP